MLTTFFLLVVLQQQQNNDKYQTLSWVISLITRLVCLLLLSRFLLFLQGRHFVWQNILLHDECENIFYQFKRSTLVLLLCDPILHVNQAKICLSFSESLQQASNSANILQFISLLADVITTEIELDFIFTLRTRQMYWQLLCCSSKSNAIDTALVKLTRKSLCTLQTLYVHYLVWKKTLKFAKVHFETSPSCFFCDKKMT